MIYGEREASFWNEASMVTYFADKDPDPRVVSRLGELDDTIRSEGTAVDLGCGGGRHTQLLCEVGFKRIHAFDVNPSMLEFTKERTANHAGRISLAYGSIGNIPLRTSSVDFTVSTGVLHQARSSAEMQKTIDDVARVHKPGAIFIGNIFVSDTWDPTLIVPDPKSPEFVVTKEGVGMTLVSSEEAAEMFVRSGFMLEHPMIVDTKLENTGPRAVMRFSAVSI